MEKRRFTEKYRHWLQAAWFAFTNGYARGYVKGKIYTGNTKALCVPGLNCYSCPGAIGACPIGSLQAILGSNAYQVSLYVLGFISLFGVLFGRMVCGFLCPFGLVQDLLYKIPSGFKKKNLPGHKYLKYLRYVILFVFVILLTSLIHDVTGTGIPWFCEWICPSGTLFAGLPLIIPNPEFREAVGFQFYWKLSIMIIILIGSVFYYRPFCKYICPLGAIYGVFNPVSTFRIVVDNDKCVKCGMCQKACGMDIRTYENPNSTECIRCLKCASACPMGAIDTTWNIERKKFEAGLQQEEEAAAEPKPLRTLLLALLAFAGGIGCVATELRGGLFLGFVDRFEDLVSLSAILVYTLFNGVKVGLSIFLIITAVFMIKNRDDGNTLKLAKERFGTAEKIYLISLAVFIVGMVFNLDLLSLAISSLFLAPYLLAGLPLLYWAVCLTVKRMDGKRTPVILWWVLFALSAAVSAVGIVYSLHISEL